MTPRRILLTILALLLFGTAFWAYDRFLGWIDGLPLLPDHMLVRASNSLQVPARRESPTIQRLKEAFGENCPEQESANYPMQLQFINGDSFTVVASGRPPTNPGKNSVELSPFSAAMFGKSRPEHLRQPGEMVEITTFHSDKAILVFDKPIMAPTDMNTAKLVRMELISDPENTIRDPLGRRGRVHICNNQRSPDSNRRLQFKSIGPVFYRDTTRFMVSDWALNALKKDGHEAEAIVPSLLPLKDREFWREDFVQELSTRLGEKFSERLKARILAHASVSPSGTTLRLGEDIWTDAAIEVIDFSNIPHREGSPSATAPADSEEVRTNAAVAGMLSGLRLPPPTVTAIGMKVYLIPDEENKSQAKKGSAGFSGLRRIELAQQVTMHLWMEAGSGMVGSEGKSSTIPEAPPAAFAAGGALIPALYTYRQFTRDMMQIETRGPFSYDAEKNLARFEVLPQADPNLTNDVRATKVPPRPPGMETLFSQILELEFNGSPIGSSDPQSAKGGKPAKTGPTPTAAAKEPPAPAGGGPQFKRLHAFTTMPGHLITVSSDADQMVAYGQDLERYSATDETRLRGSPLYVVQQQSVLQAGGPDSPGLLVSEQVNAGAANKTYRVTQPVLASLGKENVPEAVLLKLQAIKNKKLMREELVRELNKLLTSEENKQYQGPVLKHSIAAPERRTTIQGVGLLKLWDPAAKTTTMAASWKTSLVVTKEQFNDRELELYTFTDDAKIEDLQSDYRLNGKIIKLWMAPQQQAEGAAPAKGATGVGAGSRSQLDHLQAVGDVTSHSADLDIEHTDILNAWVRDIPPPEPEGANEPAPAKGGAVKQPDGKQAPGLDAPVDPANQAAAPAAPTIPDGPPQPKEPEKPKPPMKVRARNIDSWLVRYPQPKKAEGEKAAAKAAATPAPRAGEEPGASGGMKYELEKAICEGMVTAHQDPDDPSKPRGTDITGSSMVIESSPQGSRLEVKGWDFKPGEVHNEDTSLIGPVVFIDQVHNIAIIKGRGVVRLKADGELSGSPKKPTANADPKTAAKPEDKSDPVIIHFRDKMVFEGTKKLAIFEGKVDANQGEARILCHDMRVTFDRPVYLTQANRPGSKPGAQRPADAAPARAPTGKPAPGATNADDEQPKIDVIYCYPAAADSSESDLEKLVVFLQKERDPETGKPTRDQRLFSREMTIRAQAREDGRGEPFRMVLADGPGVTRIWAPESKDDDSSPGPTKPSNSQKQSSSETEMKLTIINFDGRMIAKDKGESFKEARFLDNIQVVNLPTDNPDLQVEFFKLPTTAVRISSSRELKVWAHKNPRNPDGPATQFMHAYGNAFLQNETYDGWGEQIRSEGKTIWFDGVGLVPAHIKNRLKGDESSGEQIRLERGSNRASVTKSIGGTFIDGSGPFDGSNRTNPPPPPPKQPGNNNNNNPNSNRNTPPNNTGGN